MKKIEAHQLSRRRGRIATGNTFRSRGKLYARVSSKLKRLCVAMPGLDDVQGAERAALLTTLASKLDGSGNETLTERIVTDAAKADVRELAEIVATVERLVAGQLQRTASVPVGATFADVAKAWTSGDLARQHPDHVKVKKTADDDRQRLETYVVPLLRTVPMRSFSLDHAERVMAALPPTLRPATRRQVAQAMHRVAALAVYPLRQLKANPLPRGFLPKVDPADQRSQVKPYPDESDALVSCTDKNIALGLRVFVGFLSREGMRHEEGESLRWRNVDLERGLVHPSTNKTGDVRKRPLRPDVVRALMAYKAHRGDPGPDAPVFVDDTGKRLRVSGEDLRAAYLAAGVVRAELHAGSDTEDPSGFHALRGLFVTEALARGMTNEWCRRRTRHRSDAMLQRYNDEAKSWLEAGLRPLADLDMLLAPAFAAGSAAGSAGPVSSKAPRRKHKRFIDGTEGRTRTDTPLREADFEDSPAVVGVANRGKQAGFEAAKPRVASADPAAEALLPAKTGSLFALVAAADRLGLLDLDGLGALRRHSADELTAACLDAGAAS